MRTASTTRYALAACLIGAFALLAQPAEARPKKDRRGKVTRSKGKTYRKVTPPKRSSKRVHRAVRRVTRTKRVVHVERSRRTTRKVVTHRRPARTRKVVHVHRRPHRTTKVVHVHRPAPRRRTVVVHRPAPATRTGVVHQTGPAVEETAYVEPASDNGVDGYIGAGLTGFSPLSDDTGVLQTAGINVHAGLLFDDRFALEFGWTGATNSQQQTLQAGTLDLKAYLTTTELRPYLLAGAGLYALQARGDEALVGPGVQLGGGVELGDGPLTIGAGATWRGMSLSPLDEPDPSIGQDLSAVSANATLTLRF